jgi:S-DNA-T family DNA segregation ATPase FtsK/SpoIIIE
MTLFPAARARHAVPVPAFTLPITVRDGDRTVRLLVRLARPLRWSAVRTDVCRAAGLDDNAVLHSGAGAVEDSWLVGSPPLLAGCMLATAPENEARSRDPLVLVVVGGPDAGRLIPVNGAKILIGRSDAADLRLTDSAVSWRHAMITPAANGLDVTDLDSTNGVFVDGVRVGSTPPDGPRRRGRITAVTGSVIRIGDSVLQIQLVAEPPGAFRADGYGHAVREGAGLRTATAVPAVPARPLQPEPPPRRSLPLVAALIGAAVGTVLAIAVHNPLYLAFAALGPATMVGSALSDRLRGRQSLRRQLRDFRAATAEWERAALAAAATIRRQAWLEWPGPAELLRRAEACSARLWTRQAGSDGDVSVGFAERAVPDVSGREPGPGGADVGADTVLLVPDMPVPINVGGVIGFVGATGRGVARYVLAQVACSFSPNDVTLVLHTDRDDLAACHELPHAVDPAGRAAGSGAAHRTVVVLDGREAMLGPEGAAALRAAGPAVAVLCLAPSRRDLPANAVEVAALAVGPRRVTPTALSEALLQRMCRALAPLRDRAVGATGSPTAVDLTDLTGPIDAGRVAQRWRAGPPRALLGRGPDGAVGIDLDADGPHLLIAGTTGAGKSELLQTFVASMAVAASPQAVTFLLVDYKGGAAFGAITELPHVVGVLTDLDSAGSSRALASLRAELRRRERLDAAGAPRPAKLVVVIDEFATLAAELPEFLAGMLDIAQRGRSLGLHLVVATQRPAGVVSPAMRANINARICLRVTDPAESLDVIGIPDAATLPQDSPGRAIARLGGAVTEFQTARVSVATPPEVAVTVAPQGAASAHTGGADSTSAPTPSGPVTILHTIIEAARIAARGMPPADRPWLPPLPRRITPAEVAPTTFAVADRPEQQRRCELAAPATSALVLGTPQSGRSTALRRIAALAADGRQELVVIDGADSLAPLQRWPAVSTYLSAREPRLILRVLTLLSDPARRPRDGHLRHVVIDHLDLVMAEIERTDVTTGSALLTNVLTRGAASVRVTAAGPEHMRHQRVASAFRTVIELGDGLPLAAGRGTWSGQTIQVVDAADRADPHPCPAEPQRDTIVVRPLPAVVRLSELPAPAPEAIPFAVGGDAALPLTVDLTGPGGGIIVAGPRRSGVTTAVATLARQVARAGIPVLWVASQTASAPDLPGVTTIACHTAPDLLAAALRAHQGPLVLVADHGDSSGDHPAAALFERFLAVCGRGQHLLIGARADALLRARRGHLYAAASCRRGALLSPDQAHGPVLDIPLPRRSGPVTAGRGVWTWDGVVAPVQFPGPNAD